MSNTATFGTAGGCGTRPHASCWPPTMMGLGMHWLRSWHGAWVRLPGVAQLSLTASACALSTTHVHEIWRSRVCRTLKLAVYDIGLSHPECFMQAAIAAYPPLSDA